MVIQNNIDNEAPVEVPILLKSVLLEQEDFHKNHLQELKLSNKKRKKLKEDSTKVKKSKTTKKISATSPSEELEKNNVPSISEISVEDLKELQTVYQQCKAVIQKIESKYGHLLDLDMPDSETTEGSSKKSHNLADDFIQEDFECQCTLNRKIVFDEDGKEVVKDVVPSDHICPKKILYKNQMMTSPVENRNIQIEYHNDKELSDNLQELRNILQNPEIETSYRNLVIDKLKLIKQEHSNELKFNKHAIIEKIKANPDEMISFNGSNLSGLTGYLY